MRIGFIGAGNMAQAFIGGLLAKGHAPSSITVCDPAPDQLAAVSSRFGVATNMDNAEGVAASDVLVLAVKPQMTHPVLTGLSAALRTHKPLVISVVAGVRSAAIRGVVGADARIIRTMPNRPALMGAGVSALYADPGASERDRQTAEHLLQAIGKTVWVPREEDLDAVTAVSGSGPAYFFLLTELLEATARELGLEPRTAHTLAIETAYGSGLMARASDSTLEQLREQVTSKGGTTAAALAVLEDADLRGIVRRAVTAACRRSNELARELGS